MKNVENPKHENEKFALVKNFHLIFLKPRHSGFIAKLLHIAMDA